MPRPIRTKTPTPISEILGRTLENVALLDLIFPENVHDDKRVCGREQELEDIFQQFWGSLCKEEDIPQFCLQVH